MVAPQYFIEEFNTPKTRRLTVEREINLAKWPQLFATRRTAGQSRRIQRGDSEVIIGCQTTNKDEEIEVGFLIVPDYVTLLGLIYMWELYDRPADNDITVHVRSFVSNVLQRSPSKPTYDYLERSLKRLKQVPIRWVKAFHDSKTGNLETITDEEFNFLQYLKLRKVSYQQKKPTIKTFSFKFNSHFLDNLLNQETRPITLSEVVNFDDEKSVLAYAFLDLIMAKKFHWERRATAFLMEDLQITAKRYKKPSNARDAVQQIAEELDGRDCSSGRLFAKVRKVRKKNEWKLVVDKQGRERSSNYQTSVSPRAVQNDDPEIEDLVDQMARILGNRERNQRFYRLIANKCPRELINTVLQDTLDEERSGTLEKTRSQFFGYWIQVVARRRGIDLGIKSSFDRYLDN